MARPAQDMAETLIQIYRDNEGRYRLSGDAFKTIAGKTRLREAYLGGVDQYLREDGYVLIDLREEQGYVAVVRQSVPMKCEDLSDKIDDHVFHDDEWDEE